MEPQPSPPTHETSHDNLPHLLRLQARYRQAAYNLSAPLRAISDDLGRLCAAQPEASQSGDTTHDIEKRIARIQHDLTRIACLLRSVLVPEATMPLQEDTYVDFQRRETIVFDKQRRGAASAG